ncbi:hypothetical protein J6590_077976 [Homalodisca vitripennis]|nr:hypothetical protein J6590_077976 [Homalodisca vitripennis]
MPSKCIVTNRTNKAKKQRNNHLATNYAVRGRSQLTSVEKRSELLRLTDHTFHTADTTNACIYEEIGIFADIFDFHIYVYWDFMQIFLTSVYPGVGKGDNFYLAALSDRLSGIILGLLAERGRTISELSGSCHRTCFDWTSATELAWLVTTQAFDVSGTVRRHELMASTL